LFSEEYEFEDGDVPEGPAYPLTSKRLKVRQLQQIAWNLQLPTSGTAAVTRQLVESKLTEMGREPRNVQVVIKGTGENDSMFLIDENGLICVIKPACDPNLHASQPVDEAPQVGQRSALCESGSEYTEINEQQSKLQHKLERCKCVWQRQKRRSPRGRRK